MSTTSDASNSGRIDLLNFKTRTKHSPFSITHLQMLASFLISLKRRPLLCLTANVTIQYVMVCGKILYYVLAWSYESVWGVQDRVQTFVPLGCPPQYPEREWPTQSYDQQSARPKDRFFGLWSQIQALDQRPDESSDLARPGLARRVRWFMIDLVWIAVQSFLPQGLQCKSTIKVRILKQCCWLDKVLSSALYADRHCCSFSEKNDSISGYILIPLSRSSSWNPHWEIKFEQRLS